MKTVFENIYKEDIWNGGSGAGSFEIETKPYRDFIRDFLKFYNISSVIDIGCGDWQMSKHIDWSSVKYTGVDIVENVINKNKELFSSENVNFICSNSIETNLPDAELLIIKDVIQHWSHNSIISFLPKLKKYKYALITNCIHPVSNINREIMDGDFRPLDLNAPPYNMNLKQVFMFTNNYLINNELGKIAWIKKTLLYENK